MNERDRQRNNNEILSLIRFSNKSGSHTNCFRGPGKVLLDPHETTKYLVYSYLRAQGHNVITEPIFIKESFRPDIIDLDTGICYEILHSETEEKFKEKQAKYPENLEIRKIKSVNIFDHTKESIREYLSKHILV